MRIKYEKVIKMVNNISVKDVVRYMVLEVAQLMLRSVCVQSCKTFKVCCRALEIHAISKREPETSEVHFAIGNLKTEVIDIIKAVTNKTWYKDLKLDNIKITFTIDTGVNINVLPLYYIDKNKQ